MNAKIVATVFPRKLLSTCGMQNRDFPPISRFISQTMQNMATVTMEDE